MVNSKYVECLEKLLGQIRMTEKTRKAEIPLEPIKAWHYKFECTLSFDEDRAPFRGKTKMVVSLSFFSVLYCTGCKRTKNLIIHMKWSTLLT